MRALPFACVRSAGRLALPETPGDVATLLADETYLRDDSPSYFAWQTFSTAAGARMGLIAALGVGELLAAREADGTGRDAASEGSAPTGETARVLALGHQDAPVVAARANEPVLGMILGAAAAGTPIYRFTLGEETHTLWEIKRGETLDAIHALLERMEAPRVVDVGGFDAVAGACRALRDEAVARGGYTGREPFNWMACALFTEDALAHGVPELPRGLILRALA